METSTIRNEIEIETKRKSDELIKERSSSVIHIVREIELDSNKKRTNWAIESRRNNRDRKKTIERDQDRGRKLLKYKSNLFHHKDIKIDTDW